MLLLIELEGLIEGLEDWIIIILTKQNKWLSFSKLLSIKRLVFEII